MNNYEFVGKDHNGSWIIKVFGRVERGDIVIIKEMKTSDDGEITIDYNCDTEAEPFIQGWLREFIIDVLEESIKKAEELTRGQDQ